MNTWLILVILALLLMMLVVSALMVILLILLSPVNKQEREKEDKGQLDYLRRLRDKYEHKNDI